MDDSRDLMRIELDGNWSAAERGPFFAMSELYNIKIFLQLLYDETRDLERYYFDMIGPMRRIEWLKRFSQRGFGPLAF